MRTTSDPATFLAFDPSLGQPIDPVFPVSTAADVAEACRAADAAFDTFRELDPEAPRAFPRKHRRPDRGARRRAGRARDGGERPARGAAEGERGRTVGQLRLFARRAARRRLGRRDARSGAARSRAAAAPRPAPAHDRRSARSRCSARPTSRSPSRSRAATPPSALAAGCPVVVKGHPAHPGTSAMVAAAIRAAVAACGLPDGVFSQCCRAPRNDLGAALVADPRIKAVGFTGSRAAAAWRWSRSRRRDPSRSRSMPRCRASTRSSCCPHALAARAAALGTAFVGSLTMGAGQFCTNPGLVLALEGAALDAFVAAAADRARRRRGAGRC